MTSSSFTFEHSLANVDYWKSALGLLPVPLVPQQNSKAWVLLNGTKGNFCLDVFPSEQSNNDGRSIAWSSNVGHYLTLINNRIEVQRWDNKSTSIERYDARSVYENLAAFHQFLEKTAPRQDQSIVTHAIRTFRRLRMALADSSDGTNALITFLYLLASVADNSSFGQVDLQKWGLHEDATAIASRLKEYEWEIFREELLRKRITEHLTPHIMLTLRHSSGPLFQETHYEAIRPLQQSLPYMLPSPIVTTQKSTSTGVHFTPPAIVRTVVEEVLQGIEWNCPTLTIFDPACGSGEFLREILRQLRSRGFKGGVYLVGWDISESACIMARFVLAREVMETSQFVQSSAPTHVEIKHTNSLEHFHEWPANVDIILMNPPFLSWNDMDEKEKQIVTKILEEFCNVRSGRFDRAYAFFVQAVQCLKQGGIIGSIVPSSFLDANNADKVRSALGQQLGTHLIARLGSQSLFVNALVDVALYIGVKGEREAEPALCLWSDHRPSSSSASFRALRQLRFNIAVSSPSYNDIAIDADGYSIYSDPELGHSAGNWMPRPYRSRQLHASVKHMPKVKDIFQVEQGIRTGKNNAFVISREQWMELGKQEHAFFCPCVRNKSIILGRLVDNEYVFYPYGDQAIESETDLINAVPKFYDKYLRHLQHSLQARAGIDPKKWWLLTRSRNRQASIPTLVSTYFGNVGSFAWDAAGEYAVVQGQSWHVKRSTGQLPQIVGLAYLAILNSKIFFTLVSSVSHHVSGGQWDLSKRYINEVSIPDLMDPSTSVSLLEELSAIGQQFQSGSEVDTKRQEDIVSNVYGIQI